MAKVVYCCIRCGRDTSHPSKICNGCVGGRTRTYTPAPKRRKSLEPVAPSNDDVTALDSCRGRNFRV